MRGGRCFSKTARLSKIITTNQKTEEKQMANGQGGFRANSGRKKKSFNEKTTMKTRYKDMSGQEMPEPSAYLSTETKGASHNKGKDIFTKTWEWLVERECDSLIHPSQVEQYAMTVARWMQAEDAIHTFGFLAKHPTTGSPIASPYVKIAQDFLKQSTNMWLQIYAVIKENCIEYAGKNNKNASEDMMEILLSTNPMRGINGNK